MRMWENLITAILLLAFSGTFLAILIQFIRGPRWLLIGEENIFVLGAEVAMCVGGLGLAVRIIIRELKK